MVSIRNQCKVHRKMNSKLLSIEYIMRSDSEVVNSTQIKESFVSYHFGFS